MNQWDMTWCREMFLNITGYVYFVQMDKIGPIKIGFTKNINRRIGALQNAIPYQLNILCFFPGNEEQEGELHFAFDKVRMKGEWFLPHPKLLDVIEEQNGLNKRDDFIEANPEKDFHDESLGSPWYDSPQAKEEWEREVEKIIIRDKDVYTEDQVRAFFNCPKKEVNL